MLDFLKKSGPWHEKCDFCLKLKMCIVTHHSLKKSGPLSDKCGPLIKHDFLKKVDLEQKKVDLDLKI